MNLDEQFAESNGEAGTAAISPLRLFTCCGARPLQQGSEPWSAAARSPLHPSVGRPHTQRVQTDPPSNEAPGFEGPSVW